MATKTTTAKRTAKKSDDGVLDALQKQNDMLKAQNEQILEQNKMFQEQIAQLTKQIAAGPQTVYVSQDKERVDFLWLAPVADENELLIGERGEYGKITGKVGNFSVPKNDLSRILDSMTRGFLDDRWLIVLNGFTDEERKMYGVDYKPGEVLDKNIFKRMFDIGDQIVDIYADLCDESKKIVAKMYYEAWADNNKEHPVSRDLVVRMNKIAPQPAFKAVIDGMNRKDAE